MLVPIEPKVAGLPASVTVPQALAPIVDAIRKGGSLTEPICRIARSMGYTTFVYGVGTGKHLKGDERFYVWSTAPREWVAEYDQCSYVEIDPRVTHAWTVLPPPLIWDASVGDADPKVAAFLERAAKHGIGSGVAIYLHDYSTKVLVALSQPQRRISARRRAQMSARMGDAMALASIFHLIFMKEVVTKGMAPLQQGSPLSPRERQCLQLAAHGMTSIDIGEKLGITERTANFHFSNIISKLGVLNRNEAIAKGVGHGLIQVDTSATPIVPMHASKIREAQLKRWEALHNARSDT
jgi:LuxR family quorum-sensing transcriptional regulator LasR